MPEPFRISERMPHFYSPDCPKFEDGVPTMQQLDVKDCAHKAMQTYIYANLVDPRPAQDSTLKKRARRKQKTLETRVGFTVERDGSITEVKTVFSSGKADLDRAAREVISFFSMEEIFDV